MKTFLRLGLFGLILILPQKSFACTIPVFRYALEQWELGAYELFVYHHGSLAADVQARLKHWSGVPLKANVEITTIDLDGNLTPAQRSLWQREGKPDAPAWMIVRLQATEAKEPSAWSSPCTPTAIDTLMASPLRQTIVDHLVQGTSIVFVLLTSDDADADQKQQARLTKQLAILEKRIKLPVQSAEGPQMRLPLPLKVALPLLVLDRNDPREAGLVRLLLATEEGLDKEPGPILFPIFGRGRVFPSVYGDNFTDDFVFKATEFLCKDCSCQVKSLSPGVDLLLAANWDRIFDQMFERKKKTPTATPVTPTIAPTLPFIQPEPCVIEHSMDVRDWLWMGVIGAAALVVGTGAWMVWRLR